MKNIYFIMRHGESRPNVAGIILSHFMEGRKDEYTLTPHGEEQVRQSVVKAKENGELDGKTIIISSPFSRTMRTAQIAKEVLGVQSDIVIDERLAERWFGEWEQTSSDNYHKVWFDDTIDSAHTNAGVESADSVQRRTLSLIEDLDRRYDGQTILLISHGDALQILQTGLLKQPASIHREMPPLETAEIRKLEIA